MRRVLVLIPLLVACGQTPRSPMPAMPIPDSPASSSPRLALPQRQASALSGDSVLAASAGQDLAIRHAAAVEEVLSGNVPEHLRTLMPVRLSHEEAGEATIWVTPDVVAVGSTEDHIRCPLGGPAALRLARSLQCWLPTRRMVDAIYAQAQIKLTPQPMPPTAQMTTNPYFAEHHRRIQQQLVSPDHAHSALVAGHKKDVVVTPRLLQRWDRVAISGWHESVEEPIQPLSTVHFADYADYSHGIRLVWEMMEINGEHRSIVDVLSEPELAPLLSDEGAFDLESLRRIYLEGRGDDVSPEGG